MKTSKTILESLKVQTQFRPLSQRGCYATFKRLLPPRLQKVIAFVYVKDDTLFVAIKHPGYKMELDYNKDVLKSLLSMFIQNRQDCNFMKAKKVAIFHTKYAPIVDNNRPTIPKYGEAAHGDFKIDIKDKELTQSFERIKEIIQNHRRRALENG